jgi:predicted secreted hydrolase
MRRLRVVFPLLLLAWAASSCLTQAQGNLPSPSSLTLLPAVAASPFALVTQPQGFQFPQDHGPHPDYQTEWWYYTGNLETAQGQALGYQLTFFRRGLAPGPQAGPADFSTDEIYFAHLAVTDPSDREHVFFERFSRGSAGLSGASGSPYRVWLEDWSAAGLDPSGNQVRLQARQGSWAIDLQLLATRPIVEQGDHGLSQKGRSSGNASYYLSFTRMLTQGTLLLDGHKVSVSGQSWFDHEWGTSALEADEIGWDWFGLQLSDGRDLLLYQIRRADGSISPYSSGTLVAPDGSSRPLSAGQVVLQVLGQWRSPGSGATYPSGWRLHIPSEDIDLQIEPRLADQEMRLSFVYWEGAVVVSGASAGGAVEGSGYVELTGYKQSMQGVF